MLNVLTIMLLLLPVMVVAREVVSAEPHGDMDQGIFIYAVITIVLIAYCWFTINWV